MDKVDAAHTRNFALIGHAGDGKTSLGEALLHTTGAVKELGSVDGGTSHLDVGPEEKERHHSLGAHVYGFDWNGLHLTLVDTPGDPNFQGDAQIALKALDGAILVVSAVGGAKVGTESMLRAAEATGVPLVAYVSGETATALTSAPLESLRARCEPVLLALLRHGPSLRACRSALGMRTAMGARDSADRRRGSAARPAGRGRGRVRRCTHREVLERAERREAAGLSPPRARSARAGGADRELGVPRALGGDAPLALCRRARRVARGAHRGSQRGRRPAEPQRTLLRRRLQDRDRSLRRHALGDARRVRHRPSRRDRGERDARREGAARQAALLHGSELIEVAEAGPGDVIAVAKLKDVHTGNTLTAEKNGIHLPEIPIPRGVISYAISARSKPDEDKLFVALHRLTEEDPTLHVSRDAATGEFLLTGMGELHVRIAVQKLHRLYDVDVELHTPKVPYRETIKGRAENVEGKLKKQTGGKGMYGVAYLTLEPLPRGSGVVFSDEIVGGAIPRNLIPAVEKGIHEAAQHGPLAGFPVVDVRARCIDGKFHAVDSNEMAFKLAGSYGFKAAMELARPTLLEPIMTVQVAAPPDQMGDVMGDIAHRRGRVQGTESRGQGLVVKAEVPMAEMLEYASALTSLTGGKGAFHMEFSHYDEMPAQQRDKVIAEARAKTAART
jgi:elongation factor G